MVTALSKASTSYVMKRQPLLKGNGYTVRHMDNSCNTQWQLLNLITDNKDYILDVNVTYPKTTAPVTFANFPVFPQKIYR